MSSTYTTNLSLRKPSHRDPDTLEIWDQVINGNMDLIDAQIGSKSHQYQYFIANADTHTQSLDKLDAELYAVSLNTPTTNQKAALSAASSPSGGNPFATQSYVLGLTQFNRKLVLFPEYAGATFTIGAGAGKDTGNLTTDVELDSSNYLYNFYEWFSSITPLQQYDIVCQFRIPESFISLATNNALVVDICTQETAATNNAVDVVISMDGAPTAVSLTGKTSTVAATWASERESSAVILFNASDLISLSLTSGSTINIRITVYSQNNKFTKIGAITFQYLG